MSKNKSLHTNINTNLSIALDNFKFYTGENINVIIEAFVFDALTNGQTEHIQKLIHNYKKNIDSTDLEKLILSIRFGVSNG